MTWYGDFVPMTSDKLSDFSRVKTDAAQTSFFEGREFRTFKELNIAPSGSYVIRATVLDNIILTSLGVALDSGSLRLGTYVGGTPGGTFSEVLPRFNRNNMSVGPNRRVLLSPTTVLEGGGTHADGTELDVLRIKVNANTNFAATVGGGTNDERGIATGVYYFRFLNLSATDSVTGVWRAIWEERVAVPASPY